MPVFIDAMILIQGYNHRVTVDMADVSAKQITERRAAAIGTLLMGRRAFALLKAGRLPKGDAISLAQA